MSFDEHLAPVLVDENGDRLKTFPRAKKDDDEQKHAAAKERFSNIVKDSKIVTRYQLALLERMMVSQRTFENAAFRERFVEHTFLRHLGRRVVWRADKTNFRIAEDGSFADVDDKTVVIEGPIGVAHPLQMTSELDAWRQRFTDYEIIQPFPQLARETYVRSASEIGEHDIARVVGATTRRGRLFQLSRRDWRPRFDRSDLTEYEHELPCGALARIEVTPAVSRDGPDDQPFTISLATCSYALDRLPPIEFSELIRDLEMLRA